jgi:hypothetical protein
MLFDRPKLESFFGSINKVESTKRPVIVRPNPNGLQSAVLSCDRTINLFIKVEGKQEEGDRMDIEAFALPDVSTVISTIKSFGAKAKEISMTWDGERVNFRAGTSKEVSLYLAHLIEPVLATEGKTEIPDMGPYYEVGLGPDPIDFLHRTFKISGSGFDRVILDSLGKIVVGQKKAGKNTAEFNSTTNSVGASNPVSRAILSKHAQNVVAVAKSFPSEQCSLRLYETVDQAVAVFSPDFTMFFAVAQDDAFS